MTLQALSIYDPIPPAGGNPPTPKVDISLPVRSICAQMAPVLSRCGLYRIGDSRRLVTIDEQAEMLPMTPIRFCSWVEEWLITFRFRNNHETEMTMGKDLAGKILDTDEFINGLPKIEAVAPVKLPVWVGKSVELMQPGFDPLNGIYCADLVEYPADMSLKEAGAVFEECLGEFEFPDGKWNVSRSGAVQLAAMFSTYCRHLVPAGSARPMIAYTANQPGSGKSLLACMALAPVWGDPGSTDFPVTETGRVDTAELRKELATAATERRAYVWLDDAPQKIYSNALNRFVTSSRHRGRILGTAVSFNEPNVSQVFVTANMLEVTPDLMRRALICELFVPGEVGDRTFKTDIDARWLAEPGNRERILAAMWACVREWAEAGAEMHPCPRPPGFGQWARIVGGIVRAHVADPLAPPDLPTAGDQEGTEIRKLLCALASDLMDGEAAAFTVDTVVARAREMEVLIDVVGVVDGPPLKAGERKRLGRKLAPWRGRELRDGRGRLFSFGARKQERGTVYPITWI